MNYRKITITVPEYLLDLLHRHIDKGDRSAFISSAIEEKIVELTENRQKDPLTQIKEYGSKFHGRTTEQLVNSIGRRT